MGLSLGAFDSKGKAEEALTVLSKRGIRTAKVVQERATSAATELRLPAATEALRKRLEELAPSLAGKALRRCDAVNQATNSVAN
jgi:enoyl-[acyl-carrier-protein] reductase (NADH)